MGSGLVRGGFLPPAILCCALGLLLGFLGWRKALIGAGVMAATAIAVFAIGPDAAWIEAIFLGCWLSVIGCALLLVRPARLTRKLVFAASLNAGLWVGALCSVAGDVRALGISLPFVLVCIPSSAIVARGWEISVKVVASWLTAVAILATMLSLTPTPGYVPDHME